MADQDDFWHDNTAEVERQAKRARDRFWLAFAAMIVGFTLVAYVFLASIIAAVSDPLAGMPW